MKLYELIDLLDDTLSREGDLEVRVGTEERTYPITGIWVRQKATNRYVVLPVKLENE